jgi:hypothetical protein
MTGSTTRTTTTRTTMETTTKQVPFCTHKDDDGVEDCGVRMIRFLNPFRFVCPRGHGNTHRLLRIVVR